MMGVLYNKYILIYLKHTEASWQVKSVAAFYLLKVVNEQLEELSPHQEGQLAVSLKQGHPVGLFRGGSLALVGTPNC